MPLLQGYFGVIVWSTLPLLLYAAVRRYLQGIHAVVAGGVRAGHRQPGQRRRQLAAHLRRLRRARARRARRRLGHACLSRVYLLVVLWLAVRYYDRVRDSGLDAVSRHISRLRLARLWRLGFPAALQISIEVVAFALATALAGRLDPVSSASHQLALNIAATAFMVPLGIASAGAVRVGNRVGARDPAGAARAGWTALALGGLFMSADAAAVRDHAAHLHRRCSRPARHVLALGASLLLIAAVFQLFDGLQAVATGVLRGLGDTRTPMRVNLVGHWLIGLPLGYVPVLRARHGRRRPVDRPVDRPDRLRRDPHLGVAAGASPTIWRPGALDDCRRARPLLLAGILRRAGRAEGLAPEGRVGDVVAGARVGSGRSRSRRWPPGGSPSSTPTACRARR